MMVSIGRSGCGAFLGWAVPAGRRVSPPRLCAAPLACLVVAAALAPVAATQTTSPNGFGSIEGNSAYRFWWGGLFQVIDTTNPTPATWTRIAFRRDAREPTSTLFGPTPGICQVTMGAGDWRSVSPDLARNFRGPATVVFPRSVVTLPDWRNSASPGPRPFDFVLPFPAPFFHAGGDLAWELEMLQLVDYYRPFDMAMVPFAANQGQQLGTGCVVNGSTAGHWSIFENGGPGLGVNPMVFTVMGSGLPATSPTALLLDIADRNLQAPQLCTTAHALALTLPLGTTSATGVLARAVSLPHIRSLVGQPLVSQLVTAFPAQAPPRLPLVLSDGQRVVVPSGVTGALPVCFVVPGPVYGFVSRGGCAIAEFR